MTTTPPLPADNRFALRQVARACRKAALATRLVEDGSPYVSLVTVALDHDLSPILLLSGLADHTRNLAAAPVCSLLFDGTDGHPNPQTGPRVTLAGTAERDDDPRLKARFLARHPAAALYAGFGDFGIWRVRPARAHFVGGFGRAVWFDAPFGLDPAAAAAMAGAEEELLTEMNATHADAIAAYASRMGEGLGCDWRMTGLDCDGADLAGPEAFVRLAFPAPAQDAHAVRTTLAEWARRGHD